MKVVKNQSEKVGSQVGVVKKKKKKLNIKINQKEEKQKRKEKRARIIVRNISYKATEDSLRQYFEKFGEIKELNLLKRPDGKLVGCAFIQYEAVNQAAKAIVNATNSSFLGRPISVDWALKKDQYENKFKKELKTENSVETTDSKENKDDAVSVTSEVKEEKVDDNLSTSINSTGKQSSNDNYSDNSVSEEDTNGEESDVENDVKIKIKKEDDDVKTKHISNDVKEGCTIFIKNVPFDATSNDLKKLCQKFGQVYYALINTETISGHSKGTAFVKFKKKESADMCLRAGEEFKLEDNILEPLPALTKDEVKSKVEGSRKKEPSDTRNLYLAKEGLIMAGSKAAENVSASDMAKRHKLEQIKTQILKNLNRFVSRNRLSIHNLPLHYDNEELREMVEKYTKLKPHECRVMRENKVTVEYPKGKSKGFGFMSFKTHEEALAALRKLNNNPNIFGPVNRPIVAFSIEDRLVHNIKIKRLQKSRESNPTYTKKLEKRKLGKKAKATEFKDNKSNIQQQIKKSRNLERNKNHEEFGNFVGMPAKQGSFVRMRSLKKIREQSKVHTKKLAEIKKKEKRKKEKLMIKREKMEIERPKQGKKKPEKDNLSFLVNKYKRLLNSTTEDQAIKSKRKKWYTE